jgi:hypothetical protein
MSANQPEPEGPLLVGDSVTILIYPDDTGGEPPSVLRARVDHVEAEPREVGAPWAEVLDGYNGAAVLMSWQIWCEAFPFDAEAAVFWTENEKVWLVPQLEDDP